MTPVTTSMSQESFRTWTQRIGPWVRHPAVAAPTASVRYEVFGNKQAAIILRMCDPKAIQFEDGQEGRPLASRVLIGPSSVLTCGVAIAICHAGLPDAIGPFPGVVRNEDPLMPLGVSALTSLAADQAEALDQASAQATQDDGFERILAAALADRDTPLAIQLPERMINRSPHGGPQAALLWGLWRITRPLLGNERRRGWSFSTFEAPLGDMDPTTLPDIVFRLARAVTPAAPMTTRREVLVRLRDPGHVPADTLSRHLARLLVRAYAELGADGLGREIQGWIHDTWPAERRMEAVYEMLDSRYSAVTVLKDESRFVPVTPPAETAGPAGISRVVRDERWQATVPWQPHDRVSPPPAPPAPPAPVNTSAAPVPAPIAPIAPAGPALAPAATLSGLLSQLAAGPGSPGFKPALQALQATSFESDPADRAAARKLIRTHGWYADVLRRNDHASFEDVVVMLFLRAVIPDLADPRVADEIANWTAEPTAPEAVITALFSAVDGAVGAQQLMEQLGLALVRRLRDDHGIHGGPAAAGPPWASQAGGPNPAAVPNQAAVTGQGMRSGQQAAAGQTTGTDFQQALWNFLDRKLTMPVSLVLAICAAVIVLIFAVPR
ncbi:MAG: hypothetical protein ACRDN0_22605 [Trebonia sp.]